MTETINVKSIVPDARLSRQIKRIFNKKKNLYTFLKRKKNEIGVLPASLLTHDLLHKLCLQEKCSDSKIGELFGLPARRIYKIRSKFNLTMKSPSYYLFMYEEMLNTPEGVHKVAAGKIKLTKNEKKSLTSELILQLTVK